MADKYLQSLQALLPETPTIGNIVDAVTQVLLQHPLHYGHGTQTPEDEAYAMVFDRLGLSYDDTEQIWDQPTQDSALALMAHSLHARIDEHIPLPYITGIAWFAGLPFTIDERALIPRSPIAELIESGFSPWLQGDSPRILDLCCGSGCIGIAAAIHIPGAIVDLADISDDALELARINARQHGVEDRVNIYQSDLYSALGGKTYDLIVSNPPYVPASSMAKLPDEYRHEPQSALEADDNGLAIVEKILKESGNYMNNNGILVVEVGEIQPEVEQRYNALPFIWLDFEHGGEGVFLLHQADLTRNQGNNGKSQC